MHNWQLKSKICNNHVLLIVFTLQIESRKYGAFGEFLTKLQSAMQVN